MTELEKEVLCIINEITENCYTGKLKVLVTTPERQCGDPDCRPLNDSIYELYLYLDRWYTPIVLSYEGNEEDFKQFVRKEIKKNKYEKIHFYKMTREPLSIPDKEDFEIDDE
jgi:hypothetical protein